MFSRDQGATMHAATDSVASLLRHYERLHGLAVAWLHGDRDDADEAVQNAFRFALENPSKIPRDNDGAQRWLVRTLKYQVLRIMPRRRLRTDDRPEARFAYCPK